ncbi:CD63 antigen isoform X1 [Diabrotica virgifera virgifera]|uniref:Tetraspanin n=1 Tax=Diabrotica virgifera virgifera TaxID=50390 RepID=A0A6P7FQ92_DIAVI|nr:CD63 antigen isoform X1 [Diabrotica virgifera virgifera]
MGCATGIVKYLVFLANLLFALAGLALIIIGILIKLNVSEATNVLPKDFGLAPILSIIIGSIVFITAFLGCCGAVKESTCMLTTYAIILLTIFILQVAIGVYAFLQIKDKNSFNSVLTKSMQDTFDKIYVSQEANETMMVTQRFFKCCGVRGAEDYGDTPVPPSCCNDINYPCPVTNLQIGDHSYLYNSINDRGCVEALKIQWDIIARILLLSLGCVAIVEIVGVICSFILARSAKNGYRRHMYA